LKKFWSLYIGLEGVHASYDVAATKEMHRALHHCIQKVSDDIERFSLNTCVSHFMICANELRRLDCRSMEVLEPLLRLIAPFAPHIAEELWHQTGREGSVHHAHFPKADPNHLIADEIVYPVSINGKKRAELVVPNGTANEQLEKAAVDLPEIIKWLDGLSIKKWIIVPGRMINIVAG